MNVANMEVLPVPIPNPNLQTTLPLSVSWFKQSNNTNNQTIKPFSDSP